MNNKITHQDFEAGVKLFVEILKAQPGLLISQHCSAGAGSQLAEAAASFAVKLNELKAQHAGR
nr:hypothetical protein [Alcaligenes faecalis]